jgi:hypothetical protein
LGIRNQRLKMNPSGRRESSPNDHAAIVRALVLLICAFELVGVGKRTYLRG